MTEPARIQRRMVTTFEHEGRWLFRSTVWTAKGQSSKTFSSASEANVWMPKGTANG